MTSNLWDQFISHATNINTGQLESEEIQFKVEIGQKFAAVRESVLGGADNWRDLLDSAFTLVQGNPMHWRVASGFKQWYTAHPADALKALKALWTLDDVSVAKRLRDFAELFPLSARRGSGTRANIVSVLLMGLDVEQYPPFNLRLLNEAYSRTAYDKPEQSADEATLYEHALGFLDRFTEEADKRGLKLRHRLDAQSVVWTILKVPIEDRPEDYYEHEEDESVQPEPDLQQLAADLHLPTKFLEEINSLLEDKKQVIFQGPPGTGKTYVAQKLAEHWAKSAEIVQFHPSYSYEDFVQGFRPKGADGGQVKFELQDGPLLRIAKDAQADPGGKYYLIIDEINRGIIAKVFGELYFLLEYRDTPIRLQYSEKPFSLPPNLYIIGTMNTADRSIALVDLALRRRFYFVEFHPNEWPINDLLHNWLKDNASDMAWVADVVDRANDKLNDRNAAIGPSYFMKDNLDEATVERIWEHSVLPYIEERLFREEDTRSKFSLYELRKEASPSNAGTDDRGVEEEADGVDNAST